MKKKNGMSLTAKCIECKTRFTFGREGVKYQKPFKLVSDNTDIMLSSFECPHCGHTHFIQVDNQQSVGYCLKVEARFKKLSEKRIAGKTISKKQSDEFKSNRESLQRMREELQEKYNGQLIKDENGVEFILEVVNFDDCM